MMEQRSPSFDSVVGSPRGATDATTSLRWLARFKGYSMLPVVSTLIFGCLLYTSPSPRD